MIFMKKLNEELRLQISNTDQNFTQQISREYGVSPDLHVFFMQTCITPAFPTAIHLDHEKSRYLQEHSCKPQIVFQK